MHPQTQGKDERFHRTLKFELLDRRGFNSLEKCQPVFDEWREQYNTVRPHYALGQKPPVCRYLVSARNYPEVLPLIEYPNGEFVRKVRGNGHIAFRDSSSTSARAWSESPSPSGRRTLTGFGRSYSATERFVNSTLEMHSKIGRHV
jgi:hypothetical protein